MEKSIEQSCKNCRDYRAHFIKQDNRLWEIDGHCVNREWAKIRKNNYKLHDDCPHWEHETLKINKRKESIEETIVFMKKQLDDILLILQDDKKRLE